MSNDELIAPFISNDILISFVNDHPFIKELIEYKRDGTLLLLKSQSDIFLCDGKYGIDTRTDIKDWETFIEFSRHITRNFIQEGLKQKYQSNKNDADGKKKYQIIDMRFLDQAIEIISNTINREYLKKFPKWPKSGTQESYIELNEKNCQILGNLKMYWLCRGTIFVKDTRYSSPINGCNYRAEFSGKPEFQLSYFDLDKISQCNEMAQKNINQIKGIIDKLEEKILNKI